MRLSALLIVAAIFAACGIKPGQQAAPTPASEAPKESGRLEISSAPAGATILLIPEVEGQALEPQHRGQTPTTIEVVPGKYTVHLEKPGYGYFQKEVEVKSNETVKVEAKLKRSR
jgi:uncharacterized membrane protein